MVKYLALTNSKTTNVMKTNNAYRCIMTEQFLFLDISNFLAPGTSYSQFLKAFDCREKKGYFCYEWFDGPDKLNHNTLPNKAAFYSELKGCNVLESEFIEYRELLKTGLSEDEACKKLGLTEVPNDLDQNYNMLQDIWTDEEMYTFADFLAWYNNLDVRPFVEAVTKMLAYYKSKGIDLFKDAISVPGTCGAKAVV